MSNRNAISVSWREEFRATLRLAWPLIIAQMAQMALTTTDVIMMGWLGPEPLARTAKALQPVVAPLCRDPLPVREIAIYGDPGGGAPFRLLRRLPLRGCDVFRGGNPR